MKKISMLTWAVVSLAGISLVQADQTKSTSMGESADVNNSIEMARSLFQANKKTVVADNLGLTDQESANFWKVYNEFQTDLQKVGDKKVNLIKTFASQYDSMTDDKATSLMNDFFKVQKDELKVRESYRTKFMKVLPAKKVARYYQIENKISSVVNLGLANEIPLAK